MNYSPIFLFFFFLESSFEENPTNGNFVKVAIPFFVVVAVAVAVAVAGYCKCRKLRRTLGENPSFSWNANGNISFLSLQSRSNTKMPCSLV